MSVACRPAIVSCTICHESFLGTTYLKVNRNQIFSLRKLYFDTNFNRHIGTHDETLSNREFGTSVSMRILWSWTWRAQGVTCTQDASFESSSLPMFRMRIYWQNDGTAETTYAIACRSTTKQFLIFCSCSIEPFRESRKTRIDAISVAKDLSTQFHCKCTSKDMTAIWT